MSLLDDAQLRIDGVPAAGVPDTPGTYDVETRLDARRRGRFTLRLPAARTGARRPLCLVLHYGGEPTRFYGRPLLEQLFAPALDALGACFVAPEALGGTWTDAANENYVMQLLDGVVATFALDAARVVVAGYSMGAIGCWHFIEHYPERFSAALPVAGLPAAPLTTLVPVYTFATPGDEIFPLERFADLVAARRAAGQHIRFTQVDAHGHYDVQGFAPALRAALPWLLDIWAPASRHER